MKVVTGHRIQLGSVIGFRVLMVLALSLLVVLPAEAKKTQGGEPRSPQTSVSSDGTTTAAAPRGMRSWTSPGFVGTGPTTLETAFPRRLAGRPAPTGGITPASVIGTDDRYQIESTTDYPYRAIAKITSTLGDCTGWLIGPNTVVTAGHCVFNGTWADNVRVYPGRSGSGTPYGSCGAARINIVLGWRRDLNPDYDYAAIKLDCMVGNTTGWFGLRWTTANMTGQPAYTAGYPADKTYGTLWRSNDRIGISRTFQLFYGNDTAGGQTGSPIWDNDANCWPCGIAIHTRKDTGIGYNHGTRITQEVFNNLLAWRDANLLP